jgi:hypothetical protein
MPQSGDFVNKKLSKNICRCLEIDWYSYYQNKIPFHPPDNFVEICKNSQTKARKREHVHDF